MDANIQRKCNAGNTNVQIDTNETNNTSNTNKISPFVLFYYWDALVFGCTTNCTSISAFENLRPRSERKICRQRLSKPASGTVQGAFCRTPGNREKKRAFRCTCNIKHGGIVWQDPDSIDANILCKQSGVYKKQKAKSEMK